MALTKIGTDGVKDDAVTSGKIPANAVGSSELADQSVSLDKLPHGTSSNNGKFLRANNGADPSFETVSSVGGATGVDFNDNVTARFGTGNDFEISHNGSSSIIKDSGAGALTVQNANSEINLYNNTDNEYLARFINGASCELYEDGSKKFETTNTGINVTGTISVNGSALATATNSPAFSAYRSADYTAGNGSESKLDFDQERFDTSSCYDFSNNRFTPNVAGNYVFNLNFYWNGTSSNKIKSAYARIKKNGNTIGTFWIDPNDSSTENRVGMSVTAMTDMNGSSDYVEAYGYALTQAGDPRFNADGAVFGGFKLA